MLTTLLVWILHVALVVLWPLFLVGVVRKTKAILTCRRGPPLLQAYYDVAKLFRKGEVVASTTSWVFLATPALSFATFVVLGQMIPTISDAPPLTAWADLITVVYLLAVPRFFCIVAALDTGTAFGGLGGSREAFFSSLAEPVFVLALWCIGLQAGTLVIPEMVSTFASHAVREFSPVYALVLLPLVLVTLAENARIPVDDPTTHLELTMVHEAMGLEYSGRGLALIEWGSMIKLGLFLSLLANLFAPLGLVGTGGPAAVALAVGSFALRTGALAVALGLIEGTIARFAFFRVADLLGLAATSAVLALIRIVTTGR